MAASPTAVPSPKTDGGNALATLLAAAAASMHRQQQTHANVNTEIHQNKNNTSNCASNSNASCSNNISKTNGDAKQIIFHKQRSITNQTIQQQLEAKRDTLCQLLNLKPASLIDSPSIDRLPAHAPPSNTPPNKRSTSSSPSSIHQLLSSKSKMEIQHNHNSHQFHQNGVDKRVERAHVTKYENCQAGSVKRQNGSSEVSNGSAANNNDNHSMNLGLGRNRMQAATESINIPAASTTKPKNKTNHKSSTSSSSSISTDKESTNAAKLLVGLVNVSSSKSTVENGFVELRNLETWHDEDEEPMDDSCYQELVDPSNSNGWSADEMFKYNERMHKITSSYNERTLSDNYTTPLPRINNKATMRLASQLAKEIEERVLAEGRITPESSDDDELFETERMQRVQLRQQRQLDQLKNLQRHPPHRFLNNQGLHVNNASTIKTTKSSSQYSNSTETPATASLSSSPTLNDIIKPVTSSSRNILRTYLT